MKMETKQLFVEGAPFQPVPGSWTLAVLPDTQGYAYGFPEVFLAQTEWIATHRDTHRIRFVVHLGDITEQNIASEWKLARQAMDTLKEASLPYSLVLGNHDLEVGSRRTLLNHYFSPEDYTGLCGFYQTGEMENSWHEFASPGGSVLVVALEFAPRDRVLAWANQVIAERGVNRLVIIAVHAYLYHDNTRFDWKRFGAAQEYSPVTYLRAEEETGNDGEAIWQKLVSRHRDISMVLCGHVLGSGGAYLPSRGESGAVVHQIMSNFQPGVLPYRGPGGGGFLRLIQFLPDQVSVRIRTYSPWFNQWLTDPEHHFGFTLARRSF